MAAPDKMRLRAEPGQPNEVSMKEDIDAIRVFDSRIATLDYISNKYTGSFHRVHDTTKRLLKYNSSCVLFDFDVLYAYLLRENDHAPEVWAIEYFLARGSLSFALPLGAYSELLDKMRISHALSQSIIAYFTLPPTGADYSDYDLLNRLASFLLRKGTRLSIDSIKLEAMISRRLGLKLDQIKRLVRFLSHPRYLGVKADYEAREYDTWKKLITSTKRLHKKGNTVKIQARDAMNVAIAAADMVGCAKNAPRPSDADGYVLVTATQSLVTLIDSLAPYGKLREKAISGFGVDLYPFRRKYPVIYSTDLAILELLGGASSKDALNVTNILANKCSNAFDAVKSRIDDLRLNPDIEDFGLPAKKLEMAFGPFKAARLRALQFIIRDLFDALNFDASGQEFLNIERIRASTNAYQLIGRSVVDSETLLQRDALNFARSYTEVQVLFSKQPIRYSLHFEELRPGQDFTRFKIKQRPFLEDELASGELYENSGSAKTPYIVIRWVTHITDRELILAMSKCKIAPSALFGLPRRSTPIQVIDNDFDKLLHSGVIVETNLGTFGFCPSDSHFNWSDLHIPSIIDRIRSLGGPYGRGQTVDVLRYRLHGTFGSIVLETALGESRVLQHLTHISKLNTTALIGSLFKDTAGCYCDQEQLLSTLQRLFSDRFRVYP